MFRIAIVGRPNVGKSTLFNRLTRSRKALVGNEPGITRDRIFQAVSWGDKQFEVIDTGGIVPDDRELIPEQVLKQAEVAIEEAGLILLLVDARVGLTPLDREVAVFLKSRSRPFLVVANKVDVDAVKQEIYQFYELGVDVVVPVSAEHNLGIDDLVMALLEYVPERDSTSHEDELRIAIIGRPNVGKSSIVNKILGKERVIVTNMPGTTRDAVDTVFTLEGQNYRLIDTAGIRRKGRTELMAEKLSVVMARKNLEQADVVILVIDAAEGATKLDAAIGGYAHEAGKSIIIAVNKWDLIEKDTHTAFAKEQDFRERMRFLEYAPMLFVSAKSGLRVFRLLEFAGVVHEQSQLRIPTPELNAYLLDQKTAAIIDREGRRKSRVKYVCQVGSAPPTFVLFLRGSQKLHFSTIRFLINRLREGYGFSGSPIRLIQRPSRSKGKA